MLNFDALFDQATELLGGQNLLEGKDVGTLADVTDMADVQQLIADAGLDLGTLAEMTPQDAADVIAQAGLYPELLSSPQISELLGSLTSGRND